MTLVFIFCLPGEFCLFRVFSNWITLDEADVSNKCPGSGLKYICSWALPPDHFRSLCPMQCLVILDPNTFARTQIYRFRGGPWSLVLLLGLLHPPPSAKVLHKLIICDSIIRFAGTRYTRSLEPPEGPLRGRQSIIPRTIFVFGQRILEDVHMTI